MTRLDAQEEARNLLASRLTLAGVPVAVLEFSALPSINDFIRKANSHKMKGSTFEKEWRVLGHRAMETWLVDQGIAFEACRREDETTGIRARKPVITAGILVLWKIWKSSRQTKDSAFNVYTKACEDGFTDARFWPGDDDRYILGKTTIFCGLANQTRISCEIHRASAQYDFQQYGLVIAREPIRLAPGARPVSETLLEDRR